MEFEIYNPNNKPLSELPFIYGFNNGGSEGFMHAQLVTQDGVWAGSHLCSNESYMPFDLGCIKGSRPDRHNGFKDIYPNGYQMEFVPSESLNSHHGFNEAIKLAVQKQHENSIHALDSSISVEYSS